MNKSQKTRRTQKHDGPSKKTRSPSGAGGQGRRLSPLMAVVGLGLAGVVVFALAGRPRHSPNSEVIASGGDRPRAETSNAIPNQASSQAGPATAQSADADAASLNKSGNEQLKAGDVEAAIQSYRKALALTPNDEDFHLNLGIAYAKRGDLTNAEAEYRQALRLVPDYPEAHNNLGNLLLRSGKLAEAEQEFTEAISQMPEYAQAHNNLGIVRQRQNRSQESLECFQKAVLYETNYWEAHFNLAGAYFQQQNPEKAIAELRETLRINPAFQPAQRRLAQISGLDSNAPPASGTSR